MNKLNSNIMSFYHPLKTVFLDDNRAFLNALSLCFGKQKNVVMCTDPNEAMHLINENGIDLLQSIVEISPRENNYNKFCMPGLEIFNTISLIYNESRFDNIAVLVIDYEMPEINGIEFCQKLKDKHIYKILLTAEADKDTAISAFNNGYIDKYILKTSDNLNQELEDSIDELTDRYFKELSQIIFKVFDGSIRIMFANEKFKKIFNEVKLAANAVEYYLVDNIGSFLFLSENGQPTWLILSDKNKVKNDVDLLKGYEFSEILINKITNRESLLFLFSEEEYKESSKNWEKYIFHAETLDENYIYSIVGGYLTNSINWNMIKPYAHNGQ